MKNTFNLKFFFPTESSAKAAERTETINIVRTLIDYNKVQSTIKAQLKHD